MVSSMQDQLDYKDLVNVFFKQRSSQMLLKIIENETLNLERKHAIVLLAFNHSLKVEDIAFAL